MQKQSSQIMESMGKGLTQATTKDQKRVMLMMMKKKMKAEQLQKDTAASGDPFITYGFGLIAYRNTLFNLAMAFVLFSVIAIPM